MYAYMNVYRDLKANRRNQKSPRHQMYGKLRCKTGNVARAMILWKLLWKDGEKPAWQRKMQLCHRG